MWGNRCLFGDSVQAMLSDRRDRPILWLMWTVNWTDWLPTDVASMRAEDVLNRPIDRPFLFHRRATYICMSDLFTQARTWYFTKTFLFKWKHFSERCCICLIFLHSCYIMDGAVHVVICAILNLHILIYF